MSYITLMLIERMFEEMELPHPLFFVPKKFNEMLKDAVNTLTTILRDDCERDRKITKGV